MNVRDYIGRSYAINHGCLEFIKHIYECEKDYPTGHTADQFYEFLNERLRETNAPLEGDVVIMHGGTYHIGYMVNESQFIHAPYENGTSMISDIDRPEYSQKIQGFYRAESSA